MVTTARAGRANIMTMSWLTMLEFEPPLVGCVISNRNYSFNLLKIARQVAGCGNTLGSTTDKFKKFSLTPQPAAQVGAPLIEACYANLECRVVDTKMVARYGLFVLEVVQAWIDPAVKNPRTLHHLGASHFMVAGQRIKLKSKMK